MRIFILSISLLFFVGCRQAGITRISATAQRDVTIRIDQDAKQSAGQDISPTTTATIPTTKIPKK